ncbi:unnamed protein product [Polarella glacialis]|uniref:MYND-type domain-containing protein n=1 Tax=Polarella glacialis TaxID=89957 RepID=A0A813IPL3_POLGL|nr:unnamed protein product [Polarella glacialis]
MLAEACDIATGVVQACANSPPTGASLRELFNGLRSRSSDKHLEQLVIEVLFSDHRSRNELLTLIVQAAQCAKQSRQSKVNVKHIRGIFAVHVLAWMAEKSRSPAMIELILMQSDVFQSLMVLLNHYELRGTTPYFEVPRLLLAFMPIIGNHESFADALLDMDVFSCLVRYSQEVMSAVQYMEPLMDCLAGLLRLNDQLTISFINNSNLLQTLCSTLANIHEAVMTRAQLSVSVARVVKTMTEFQHGLDELGNACRSSEQFASLLRALPGCLKDIGLKSDGLLDGLKSDGLSDAGMGPLMQAMYDGIQESLQAMDDGIPRPHLSIGRFNRNLDASCGYCGKKEERDVCTSCGLVGFCRTGTCKQHHNLAGHSVLCKAIKKSRKALQKSQLVRTDHRPAYIHMDSVCALPPIENRFNCAVCSCLRRPDGSKLLLCGGCKSATFCSVEHQKQDWKVHKAHCSFQKKAETRKRGEGDSGWCMHHRARRTRSACKLARDDESSNAPDD